MDRCAVDDDGNENESTFWEASHHLIESSSSITPPSDIISKFVKMRRLTSYIRNSALPMAHRGRGECGEHGKARCGWDEEAQSMGR